MSTNFDDRLEDHRIVHLDIDPLVPGQSYAAEAYCVDLSTALADLEAQLRSLRTGVDPTALRDARSQEAT
jgi:hypothetical protein